jgi:hypothetical protein
MTYSFTKSRPKSLLQKDTKFWIAFLVTSLSILIGLQISLSIKSKTVLANIETTRAEKDNLILKTGMIKEEYDVLKERVAYAKKINSDNSILKESLKNLFEIVPDKITLERVEITPTELSLFGTTPSRDIFNLQFAPALKSIFTKSETSFVRAENGNSRFISINQIENKNEQSDNTTPIEADNTGGDNGASDKPSEASEGHK